MKSLNTIAVDIGAGSGRVSVCGFDGTKVTLKEILRFPNQAVTLKNHIYWDTLRLFHEIKTGVRMAAAHAPVSLSIDTPGQDFVLMAEGLPLFNARTYRDPANLAAMDKVASRFTFEALYALTGCRPFSGSSLVQLVQMEQLAEKADGLLFQPDFFNYLLCGERVCEPTLASTSMMLGWNSWNDEIVKCFGIGHLLPPVIKSGTLLGHITDGELNPGIRVIAGAGHDSAAAVSAVPQENSVFLSCGTWSAIGIVADRLINNQAAFAYGFTNQRNVTGNKFMTSFSALWVLQQCAGEWHLTYEELEQLAANTASPQCYIQVEAPEFFPPGNMSQRIASYLDATGQKACPDTGSMVRCILESLALKYAFAIGKLERLTQQSYDTVSVLGGGTKSALLCQFTAEATGRRVITGSAESASLGNALVQLCALGEINAGDFSEIVRCSVPIKEYLPRESGLWQEKAAVYASICGK